MQQIILRKTIEGYLDSILSLSFNTIKTKLDMHVFNSFIYPQSKWMFNLSHFSYSRMVKTILIGVGLRNVMFLLGFFFNLSICTYGIYIIQINYGSKAVHGWKYYV